MGHVIKGGAWKYPGGDARMAKHILRLAPPHKTFCEPFVGGGATTWLHPGDVKFVVGDKDPMIARIWKDLKAGRLSEKLDRTTCVIGTRKNLKKLQNLGSKRTPLQNLALWRMSLMARTTGTLTPDLSTKDKPYCFDKLRRNVDTMEAKAKNMKVLQGDWKKTIEACDSPSTFHYIDPPWTGNAITNEYNKTAFNPKAMFEYLTGIKGKFLMYHSFNQEIADLARDLGFYTYRVGKRTKAAANARSVGNGDLKSGYLFVTNYNIPRSRWKEK